MVKYRSNKIAAALMGSSFLVLAGCEQPLDFDLRNLGSGFNTTDAARQVTANRPQSDDRGVISYPNYQVAIARSGDRLDDIANRIGIPVEELSRYNGIGTETVLRANEVIALPRRVEEPTGEAGTFGTDSAIDITSLAGNAIDRAGPSITVPTPATGGKDSIEPIRHKVERGETAFSISRLYNVSVRALSDWNGLGPDLAVRSGQFLLIPVVLDSNQPASQSTTPGQGSPTPEPPSASTPLPEPESTPAPKPPSPDLGGGASGGSDSSALATPTSGSVIRAYEKGSNEGIDIAAPAGTPVVAAADGSVAAITRDTDQVPILVIKHANNLLTVYAGVDNLTVRKGSKVKRGQKIAEVRAGSPSFLHFEVRKGLESTDPMQYLN